MPSKRPFGVTLLLWMVLSLSVWGATRFVATLQTWNILNEFGASLSPLYLSLTGAGWGVVGGALLVGILARKAWTRLASFISIFIWLIEYWLERIFFQTPRANLPFALACTVMVIIVPLLITILLGTKSYFTKSEEHEQSNENPNLE